MTDTVEAIALRLREFTQAAERKAGSNMHANGVRQFEVAK